jgi:4-hydroxybenzoyl-CoA thioesterase/acyl-CoA thioester hydrolase
MPTAFTTTRRVEFSDTDAAGIAHFVAFFRWMEQAEHDLLRSVGLSVVTHDADGVMSWPRVNAKCDFRSALRFEDVVQIEVSISRLGEKSITFQHRFLKDGQDLALGEVTSVCCRLPGKSPPQPIPIPDWYRERLARFAAP